MAKTFRPTTSTRRHLVLNSTEELTRISPKKRAVAKPCKALLVKKMRTNGRNHHGHITCRHRGGGHKRFYRLIDFKRDKEKVPARVASIEYDPNRTTFIALLHYADGEKRYILAPAGLKKGDRVATQTSAPYKVGCCLKLKDMPLGSVIHNIEMHPGRGGKLVRSAGLSAQLMARSSGYATIKMPSNEVRMIHENCRATLGALSNAERTLRAEGKAGRKRWKGIRPTVRGTAMNPVDNPHGGGEGKTKGGRHPVTPWGVPTKGYKTRKNKRTSQFIVQARSK